MKQGVINPLTADQFKSCVLEVLSNKSQFLYRKSVYRKILNMKKLELVWFKTFEMNHEVLVCDIRLAKFKDCVFYLMNPNNINYYEAHKVAKPRCLKQCFLILTEYCLIAVRKIERKRHSKIIIKSLSMGKACEQGGKIIVFLMHNAYKILAQRPLHVSISQIDSCLNLSEAKRKSPKKLFNDKINFRLDYHSFEEKRPLLLYYTDKLIKDPLSPSERSRKGFKEKRPSPLYCTGKSMEDPLSPSDRFGIRFNKKWPLTKFKPPQASSFLSYPLTIVNIECLKYELLRLKTFKMSEIGENMQSWVLEIASTGFYLSGKRGEVTCFSCSRRHYNLLAGTSMSDAHEPDCHWHEVNKPLSCFTEGLSSMDLNAFDVALANNFGPQNASSLASADLARNGAPSASGSTVSRDLVDGVDSALAIECQSKPTICQEESPQSAHKMLTSATENEPYDFGSHGTESAGADKRDAAGRTVCNWDLSGASFPQFANRQARKETFKYWNPNHMQKPDDLVALGFFFSGYSDCARCFYCGLGLKYWRPNDDAAYQHARYRPFCLYNRLVKGQAFIDHVQEMINQQGTASSAVTVAAGDSHLLMINSAVTAATKGWSNEAIIKAIKSVMQGTQTDASNIAYAHLLPHLESFQGKSNHDGLSASSRRGQQDPTSHDESPSSDESRILACRAAVYAVREGWDQEDVLYVIRNLMLGSSSKLADIEYSMLEPGLQIRKAERQGDKNSVGLHSAESTAVFDGRLPLSGIKRPESPEFMPQIEPLDDHERIRYAEEEHELLKSKMYCMVCKVNRIGCIFLPCGHVVACQECGERATACSLCSKHIIALANIYLS